MKYWNTILPLMYHFERMEKEKEKEKEKEMPNYTLTLRQEEPESLVKILTVLEIIKTTGPGIYMTDNEGLVGIFGGVYAVSVCDILGPTQHWDGKIHGDYAYQLKLANPVKVKVETR